jgi:3-methyl-2-oxobutanoate hydroxymethyltransferase
MLHHCKAVARGCRAPFLIGDLPFGSYESNPEDAVKVALRFIKEGNVEVCMNLFSTNKLPARL